MKKIIAPLLTFAFLLSGCSFLGDIIKSNPFSDTDDQSQISSFEFLTDDNMTIKTSTTDGSEYYLLTMYVGDTYQVRTNVDDQIGSDYYFEYSDYDEAVISVSDTGVVTGVANGVDSVSVKLYRKGNSKRIDYHYFIVNVKEASSEYANITLNDPSLTYDADTRTYSLNLNAGDDYYISTSVSYNVAYNKVFELSNSSYSSFMSVSVDGVISTQYVTEDKDGQVTIRTKTSDNIRVLDTVYLNVHIAAGTVPENTLVITNLKDNSKVNDGDNLNLYIGDSLSFGVKYNNVSKTGVMSISNTSVLSLDNTTNTITALGTGSSGVTFSFEDKQLSITVTVTKNALSEIYSKNGGDDFVIVNGQLLFLGRMFAKYYSGSEVDITSSTNLTYSIQNLDDAYKKVTFSFTDADLTKTVQYNVRFFLGEGFSPNSTAYDFKDYYDNNLRNNYYLLPKEGNVHMLVIPVWFSNSTNFFRTDQKAEIVSDLEYVYNTIREDDNYYSVKQFFKQESSNKLTITSTISEFYECGYASTRYGDTLQDDINATHDLADSAVQWYFNNHTSESIADYDANNDGKVDAVSLVYGATYYGTIGDQNGTTAFQFKDTNPSENRKYNNGSFSPLGGIYGFTKTSTTLPKDSNVTDLSKYYPAYFFNSGSRTIIHETAHMFGFIDLYEDNHASVKYSPAGKFSLQDSNYGGHDPYQMNLRGWSKPQIFDASDYDVNDTVTITISDFASSGNNILLTREMNANNSLFDEYMLLELLAPNGVNKFDATTQGVPYRFDEPGIRLWHINSTLGNMSESNADTTEISNSNWVQLKYSNNDQDSKYDLAHWIRNNPSEPYHTTTTVNNNYGLFKTGDHFDMETYDTQFVNPGLLDNKEKLGWEFDVDSVFKTVDDEYGAVITLTRVDNTRLDFDFEERINKDISDENQPTTDGNDYATLLFGSNEMFSLIYNFNDAVAPSYYTQGKPISYKGVCLFAEANGNGGSLVITIKDKSGYEVLINKISITYCALTNVSPTAIANGDVLTGEYFEGPFNTIDNYNESGKTYVVNSKSVTIQNKFTGTLNHFSVLAIYSLAIEYHLEKI